MNAREALPAKCSGEIDGLSGLPSLTTVKVAPPLGSGPVVADHCRVAGQLAQHLRAGSDRLAGAVVVAARDRGIGPDDGSAAARGEQDHEASHAPAYNAEHAGTAISAWSRAGEPEWWLCPATHWPPARTLEVCPGELLERGPQRVAELTARGRGGDAHAPEAVERAPAQ